MDRLSNAERKKYIIISSIVVVVLLAVTFAPMIFNNDSQKVETPEPEPKPTIEPTPVTTISNLGELVKNLPESRTELIENNLFTTIKDNLSGSESPSITDAIIRDGSYEQTVYDSAKQIFFTTFIVDVPSLKQSYRVNDYYSPLPAQVSGLFDYATLVLCLDEKDLIYGSFECTDRIKEEVGS